MTARDALAHAREEPQNGEAETVEVVPVVFPCILVTLLPDGNLDVQMPNGPIPLDKMFTASALLARLANQTLDDEENRRESVTLEIARDMTEAARRAKPQ